MKNMSNIISSFKEQWKGWDKKMYAFYAFGVTSMILSTVLSMSLTSAEITSSDITISVFSLLTALSAFTCMMMLSYNNIWNFLWATLQSIFYIYVAISWVLWGQLLLAVVIWLPLNILGVYQWKKVGTNGVIKQQDYNTKERLIWFAGFVIFTTIVSLILFFFTKDQYPLLDTIIFTSGAVAVILAINTKSSQWMYWLIMNIASILLFSLLMATDSSNLYQYIPQLVLRLFTLTSVIIGIRMHNKDKVEHKNSYDGNTPIKGTKTGTKAMYRMTAMSRVKSKYIPVKRNKNHIKK